VILNLGVLLENLDLPFRKALPVAAKLGVEGVQLDAAGELLPAQLGTTARRELRTLLKSYNLTLAAVNSPLRHGLDTFENQMPRLEQVRQSMLLASDLGCSRVVVPLPTIPDEPTGEAPKPVSFLTMNAAPPKSVTLRESLLELGRTGDRLGITVCVETGSDASASTVDYLKSFEVGSLRIAFDPANQLIHKRDPLTELFTSSSLLGHVFARDVRLASASAMSEEVSLGAGDIEWMGFIAGLAAHDYSGFVNVKRTTGQNRPADVASAVAFLRRFVFRAS
jgi:L-ribulose-5-phosphate 3-epimerase